MNVLELKNELMIKKNRLKNDLNYLGDLLGVNGGKYLNEYDKVVDDLMIKGIELNEKKNEFEFLYGNSENIKSKILEREGVDLLESLRGVGREKNSIIDELCKRGFINVEKCDDLKRYLWDNRYKKSYSD